jgi:hypothetical protein
MPQAKDSAIAQAEELALTVSRGAGVVDVAASSGRLQRSIVQTPAMRVVVGRLTA